MASLGITLMWIIIVLTIIGNVATLIVLLAKKKLRKRPDARFLLSLSCADLAVGIFVMIPGVLKTMVSHQSLFVFLFEGKIKI